MATPNGDPVLRALATAKIRSLDLARHSLAWLITALAACAGDGRVAPPAEPALLRLEAHDFSFSGDTIVSAGLTRVRLVNHGPSWHEALLTRLPDTVSADQYLAEARAGNAFPVAATDIGGPGKVAAGDSSEVVLELEPGRYAVVCWADNHVNAGMISTLVISVTGESAAPEPVATPVATGDVMLEDFRIVHDSGTYRRGANLLRVRNTGERPHDLTFYRFAPGRTIRDFATWYATRAGDPPAIPVGGMVTLAPGREGLVELDLEPGRYFAGCGTPEQDSTGTVLHIQMGMIELFEIA